MPSKMVAVVDSKSSKADELAALRKMAECATQGSYLSSLFTPELLDWVKGQIEMDCPPDIMEQCNFRAEKQGELMNSISLLHQQVAEIKRKGGWAARQKEQEYQKEREAGLRTLHARSVQALEWRDEAHAAREKAEAYRDAVLWAWGWVCVLMIEREKAERQIEETKVRAFAMLEKALCPIDLDPESTILLEGVPDEEV